MQTLLFLLIVCCPCFLRSAAEKPPTVLIAVLVRNKAHTLPYFLSHLEELSYPKDRIALWIRGDHSVDKTNKIFKTWISSVEDQYKAIDAVFLEDEDYFPDEKGISHWSDARFNHIINLREAALRHARDIWADYVLILDCDVFLTNRDALQNLISKNLPVVAPMLKSDGLYSNFWHGMTDDYYYLRTEDYKAVLDREKEGCFQVPMVHSCLLVDLRRKKTDSLTYDPKRIPDYDGPHDDIIAFAISANKSETPLTVCNDKVYGFLMVPLEKEDNLENDFLQLTNLKLEILTENEPLLVNKVMKQFVRLPEKDRMGFDKVFVINLARRPERRVRMLHCLDELALDAEIVDAVDGKALDESFLKTVTFLPEYADPYHKRPMTAGEIGCFMSHYNTWKRIVEEGLGNVLVLEDDIRFDPFFRLKVQNVMNDVYRHGDWDLVYFGRKRLQESEETWVSGSKYLVEAGYSYWTLGYAISLRGAKKLLDADPLSKLLPVDEYFPILYDKHPQEEWKNHYPNRNLVALSASPLILYPTHYTGEKGYISDTEDSIVVQSVHEDL